MSKIRFPVRIYKDQDLDLRAFEIYYEVNLSKAIYCSLKAFAKGDYFVVKIPPKREEPRILHTKVRIDLNLDQEVDADILTLLQSVPKGFRNNFVKNMFRQYLALPLCEELLKSAEASSQFQSGIQAIRAGRREADVCSYSKKQSKKKAANEDSKEKKERKNIVEPLKPLYNKTVAKREDDINLHKQEPESDRVKERTYEDVLKEHKEAVGSEEEQTKDILSLFELVTQSKEEGE